MKKVIRYLQDQAVQASQQQYSGSAYLSPTTKEPQQRTRHHSPSQYKDQHTSHHQSRANHPSTASHSFPAHTASGMPQSKQSRSTTPEIPEELQRNFTRHQYAQDNILQSYELYIPQRKTASPKNDAQQFWVLYIHGGYFQDPEVTSSSFLPALSLLENAHQHHVPPFAHDTAKDISQYISGYASINYRLSPHPEYPQDPGTPAYELRTAEWPDHIHDILTAIAHLQHKHSFGPNYLLVGHSVGATMALLTTLASTRPLTNAETSPEYPKIEPPLAVLGVSGIYDFPALHDSFPSYVPMTRNAIPRAEDDALASPAQYTSSEYAAVWAKSAKRAVILAHSRDDGLVDWRQVDAMSGVFTGVAHLDLRLIEIHGKHDDIWGHGRELARAIREAVAAMLRLTLD